MECAVCCETMAKEIRCSCGFLCCRNCIRTYLSEQIQDPHCMSCKKAWGEDGLEQFIGKTYTSTVFKKQRAEVYFEHEKTQLAHTQSLVVKYKRDEVLKQRIQELSIEIKVCTHGTRGCIHCMGGRYKSHWCQSCQPGLEKNYNYKLSFSRSGQMYKCLACKKGILNDDLSCRACKVKHCDKCYTVHTDECAPIACICVDYACDECRIVINKGIIEDLRAQMREPGEAKEKREFIMNCQAAGCKGFLSTKYKCGLCDKYTCSGCLLVKEEGHVCKESDLSTVKMIREETKPCPKCSTRISKIDGCDQMWCVECKTAFSWKSGHIVNGTIHNPHYYDYLRQSQGFVPRADNPCGEVPGLGEIRRLVRSISDGYFLQTIFSFHRFLEEVTWRARHVNPYEEPLVHNRIMYLMNEIDQKKFTQKAFMYYQRSLRFRRISELINMLRQVLLDQLSLIMDVLRKKPVWSEIQAILLQTQQVIKYFYEQKKKSPFTSIREEHIQILVENANVSVHAVDFNMAAWVGTNTSVHFALR